MNAVRASKPREHCGVVAVRGPDSVDVALDALRRLQHRGEESSGIAVAGGGEIATLKGLGRVDTISSRRSMMVLPGSAEAAIAHVRYSTSGGKASASAMLAEAHPMERNGLAVAFNGTVPNYAQLWNGKNGAARTGTDTEAILDGIAGSVSGGASIGGALESFMAAAKGGYAVAVLLADGTVAAARDPLGIRPMVLGSVDGPRGSNLIVASESIAITALNGRVEGDLRPGEILIAGRNGVASASAQRGTAHCVFELVYFAHEDSVMDGVNVRNARIALGEALALNHGADVDIVVPVPDSAGPIGEGYSAASGIRISPGLELNGVSEERKRSFMQPDQKSRRIAVLDKFYVNPALLDGKRVALVDDSIVRGTTMSILVAALKEGGATEVHVRVASPEVLHPCFMGVDFPTRGELIANRGTTLQNARAIGADSLEYLTVAELISATGGGKCHACFSGKYPVQGIEAVEGAGQNGNGVAHAAVTLPTR